MQPSDMQANLIQREPYMTVFTADLSVKVTALCFSIEITSKLTAMNRIEEKATRFSNVLLGPSSGASAAACRSGKLLSPPTAVRHHSWVKVPASMAKGRSLVWSPDSECFTSQHSSTSQIKERGICTKFMKIYTGGKPCMDFKQIVHENNKLRTSVLQRLL